MKKIIFTLVFVVSGIVLASAQCTPGSYTQAGIYPDTATNLPKAYVNFAYATTMTAVVPLDTIFMSISVPIDSIGILNVVGLPGGFSYTPNHISGYFPGGTSGCILIAGTATTGEEGMHWLKIYTKAYVDHGLTSQLDTIRGYGIDVVDSTVGINEISGQNAISLNAYTDASNNSIVVKINSSSPVNDASLSINDITGRELMRMENLNGNEIILNRGSLSNGIYLVSLRNNSRIVAREKIFIN